MHHRAFVADVPHAFLIVPFLPERADAETAIRRATESIGLSSYWADDIRQSTSIIDRVLRGIASADVVTADLTGHRANCFYELGYADAMKRPVVLVQQQGDSAAFDVAGRSILWYRDPEHLCDELPKWLIEAAFVNHTDTSDDDQNAGGFGRHAQVGAYLLSARLALEPPDQKGRIWGSVQTSIRRIDGAPVTDGMKAAIYLDPLTFDKRVIPMTVVNGVARAKFTCYGAFSLGGQD
jgi:nucleoside 2-deoxyribosyltransferase